MKEKLREFEINCMMDYFGDGEVVEIGQPVSRVRRAKMVDPDGVVVTDEDVRIKFDYPLGHEVVLDFHSRKGFTRKQFWKAIHDGYKRIYDEEESAVGDPGTIPGMYNRAASNGPHGIWGHAMGDLVVEGVTEVEPCTFELSIGS